eukprot:scpid80269/ scgid33738/ 
MFGDYEFQTSNYGLSGSSGVRPCLHCHCTKKAMELPSNERDENDRTPRSLESLGADLARFTAAGGNISNAKHYNNVIRPPILPIPVEDAVLPALHLDLGIYSLLFDCLLRDVRSLDAQLVTTAGAALAPGDSEKMVQLAELHAQHRQQMDQAREKFKQAATLQEHLNFVALHGAEQGVAGQNLADVCANIQDQWKAAVDDERRLSAGADGLLQQVQAASKEKDLSGPCEMSIEPILQQHYIQRQAYHGGAFIGNHVHKG